MTDKELKELKDTLWHSADVLRASAHLAANKYGQPILGLIFLRYADILYKQHKEEIEAEYNRLKGGRMEKSIKEISIEKCGFYLPECAYYDVINDAPDDANKATIVKKAMEAIEDENPKMDGVLPKEVYAQLVPEEEPELLSNIVRIFKDIPENSTIDIFGEIYEYFLGNFAFSEGKDGGTFYTPATVVRYMVEVLNPQPGEKKFLDPACGSGGMFVQAARYMHNHNASESEQMKFRYDTIVAKDDDKEKFKVILNTLANLYEASKPEIFEKSWSNDKFAPLVYLHGLFYHTIDDEKVARARQKMNQILDGSVTASQDFVNYVREEPAQYMIKGTKAIDLSKVDVEQLRKEIKFAKYKAIEINDLKEYIEQALEQMLNRNCTRTKFSERFKRIIDSYNAGGTENEDYYEQLVKLLEELRQEDNRANTEGLTEEELEIYDLLIAGKKLTQAEEQKVKLSAKNLYKKLVDNRSSLLVVDWYKDEQPRAKLKYEVELSLNDDLPESYDKAAFDSKVSLLMNHFADMAVQGYGWIGAA